MKRFLLLVLTLLTISVSAFAEKQVIRFSAQEISNEDIDKFVMYVNLYVTDNENKIMVPYGYATNGIDLLHYFNRPYPYVQKSGIQNGAQLMYIKRHGKWYVGMFSTLTGQGAAFEFDSHEKAYEVLFLWGYLISIEEKTQNDVHFIPDGFNVYDDNESTFLSIPKDMITDNANDYATIRATKALIGEELFMNGEWHDLSNGKEYKCGNRVYTCVDGELYCDGRKSPIEDDHDINKMIRMSVYENSGAFYELLKSSKGYYYCNRCSNLIYDPKHRPIEMYGYHYQDITSTDFWIDKVASWRKVNCQFDK